MPWHECRIHDIGWTMWKREIIKIRTSSSLNIMIYYSQIRMSPVIMAGTMTSTLGWRIRVSLMLTMPKREIINLNTIRDRSLNTIHSQQQTCINSLSVTIRDMGWAAMRKHEIINIGRS